MDDDHVPLLGRAGHARTYRHRTYRTKTTTYLALSGVLVTETFERIAFYGVVGSLVLFLNSSPFKWSSYNATNALFVFTGISYMSSIVGGWFADSCFGKFRTIVFALCIYIAGYTILPVLNAEKLHHGNVTHPPKWCMWHRNEKPGNGVNVDLFNASPDVQENSMGALTISPLSPVSGSIDACTWVVYLSLVMMGFGNGAVKANLSPFGADQVKHDGPAAVRMFVNWFYWCINLGALISLGGLAYVQQEISFFWGYVAPNISLVIALVTFVIGGCFYIRHPPGGSMLTNIIKILHESCQKACCTRRPRTYGLVRGSPLAFREAPACCLDYAKIQYGGSYHDNMVDDVKTLGKICLVFVAMIPYWIVYFQMETTFILQGLHLRLDFSGNGTKASAEAQEFKFPVAWLFLFDIVFLILLIPLFDRVIYPALDRHGYMLSPRLRIMIGMVFSMFSVSLAGLLEMYRRSIYWKGGVEHIYWQIVGTSYYRAADVSVLLQIPQYALIGIGEVFASIAGLEIAYVLAPHTMQGLITGMFWFVQGLGSMLGSAILQSFRGVWFFSWDYGDINCRGVRCPAPADPHRKCTCHLDYYFFLLAGLQLLGIILFALIAWKLDLGLRSMYNRNTSTLEESLPITDPVEELNRTNDTTQETSCRPGYRTFQRRHSIPYRLGHETSETDTLDTDYSTDHR